MKMILQIKRIFVTMASHDDWFEHRGKEEPGNGLLEQT